MADDEAIGRLVSLALRSGVPLTTIYRQLRGISSDRIIGLGPNKVMSVPDAVGIALEKWMQDNQGVQQQLQHPTWSLAPVVTTHTEIIGESETMRYGHVDHQLFAGACPDCGSQLEFAEGCKKCHTCGFSECG